MSPYTRHQLLVLLSIVFVAGAGLAVGHWRRLHPDLVDRIERLDRAPTPDTDGPRSGDTPAPPVGPPRRSKVSRSAPVAVPASPAAAAPSDGLPMDLNSASIDALTRLPGVGPVLAARIADGRPYTSVDDLRRVRGVGRAKLERFRELVTISDR